MFLQNYLNWYAVIDVIEKAINPAKQSAKMIIASTVAWEQFKIYAIYNIYIRTQPFNKIIMFLNHFIIMN